MSPTLNENQLKLLTDYVSTVVMNNQEVHPSDMPAVVAMFKELSDKGYVVSDEQVDTICKSLHSAANQKINTSEGLRDFLKSIATAFRFLHAPYQAEKLQKPISSIANDIINEKDLGL